MIFFTKKPMNIIPLIDLSLPNTPFVSVLIANYNYAHYIRFAVESVLRQTYQNFEIILCDDGSSDNSAQVLSQIAQEEAPRVKTIFRTNGGHAASLNSAFRECKGDIICLLDPDDIWMPNKLEQIVQEFKRSGAGVVLHQLGMIDSEGHIIRPFVTKQITGGWILPNIINAEIVPRFTPTSSISIHRTVADIIFPLKEQIRIHADTHLLLRAACVTTIATISETLGYMRIHDSNCFSASFTSISKSLDAERRKKQLLTIEMIAKDIILFTKDNNIYIDQNDVFRLFGGEICISRVLMVKKPKLSSITQSYPKRWIPWWKQLLFWIIISRLPQTIRIQIYRAAFEMKRRWESRRVWRPNREHVEYIKSILHQSW